VPPNGTPFGLPVEDRAWLWKTCIEPWQAVESRGVGVMVGEWGVFNRTPHDVVLRWAEDSLRNWQQAGWGWAMWNFRGSMGIIDSGRDDVQYEDLAGHKLDRQLLDLLQRY
jgi:endoglucanase